MNREEKKGKKKEKFLKTSFVFALFTLKLLFYSYWLKIKKVIAKMKRILLFLNYFVIIHWINLYLFNCLFEYEF